MRFIRGTYAGRKGWINDAAPKRKFIHQMWNAIVDVGDDEEGLEKITRVKTSSVRRAFLAEPRTLEEAVIQQHPDIELAMIRLAEMMAQTGIAANNETLRLFDIELTQAREFQRGLKNKATCRFAEFERL